MTKNWLMKIRTKRESTWFPELDLFRISIPCKGEVISPGNLIVVDSGSVWERFMILLERVGSNGKSRELTGGNVVEVDEVPVADLVGDIGVLEIKLIILKITYDKLINK